MDHLVARISSTKPRVGPVRLLAIDGPGGAGKSTFATSLGKRLNASVIPVDDFASLSEPEHWVTRFLNDVIHPITLGAKTLSYERSSWWPEHHPEPITNLSVTPIIILEGVRALRSELTPYISFGVFVDVPLEIGKDRGMARDINNGLNPDEVAKHWGAWQKTEREYFETDTPRDRADLIVDGTRPTEHQFSFL